MQKSKRLSIAQLKEKSGAIEFIQNLQAILGGKAVAKDCHLSPQGGQLIDECTGKAAVWNAGGGLVN